MPHSEYLLMPSTVAHATRRADANYRIDALTVHYSSAAVRAREAADLKRSQVCKLAAMLASDLPVAEFAFPGPLRDQLVAAILAGEKTTTTALVAEYERENEPLPVPGLRQVVIDSAGSPVAVIETTAVRVVRLDDVDLDHALGEGEGYASVAEWRAGHEQFWQSAEMCQALGDPAFTVGDDTLVMAQEFRLVRH
jgi:uncharacterized protein YhfF